MYVLKSYSDKSLKNVISDTEYYNLPYYKKLSYEKKEERATEENIVNDIIDIGISTLLLFNTSSSSDSSDSSSFGGFDGGDTGGGGAGGDW